MRRLTPCFVAIVVLLAAACAPASAAVLPVPSPEYPTITDAMAAAVSGDTVLVAADWTCYESGIVMKDGVVIQGAGAEVTTINGGGTELEAVLIAPPGVTPSAVLDGFTITGGLRFGGLWIEGSPTISNNIIAGNRIVDYAGGGITVLHGCPEIAYNTISGNAYVESVPTGTNPSPAGGIYLEASGAFVHDNVIEQNTSESNGGGVSCMAGSPIISRNTIARNVAARRGAGIACWYSVASILDNIISDNSGQTGGGGIHSGCWSSWGQGVVISGNVITGNRIENAGDGAGAGGGGIQVFGGIHTITDNRIESNWAALSGGGIDVTLAAGSVGEMLIAHNTIKGNSSGYVGGGAWLGLGMILPPESVIRFEDNQVIENTADTWAGGLSLGAGVIAHRNTIERNVAGEGPPNLGRGGNGGGIVTWSGGVLSRFATVSNNTIRENVADSGGAIHHYGDGSAIIANNLIVRNTSRENDAAVKLSDRPGQAIVTGNTIADNLGMGVVVVQCFAHRHQLVNNVMWGNEGYDLYVTCGPSSDPYTGYCDTGVAWFPNGMTFGPGDFSLDPLFVNAAGGDYHLAALSPCIDAGDPAGDYTGQTDMDGEDRLRGPRVDTGADEALANAVILSPAVGEVLNDVHYPVFTWEAYPEAISYSISVRPVGEADVWSVDLPAGVTEVQCGVYLEGGEYEVAVVAHTPAGDAGRRARFVVYSPEPVIRDVLLACGYIVDAQGVESYAECAQIRVRDMDAGQNVSITTLDPKAQTRPGALDCGGSWNEGTYTRAQKWAGWNQTQPLAAGDYVITAVDATSLSDTITVTAPPVRSAPTILSPGNGGVVTDIVPTFTWEAVPGASYFCLCLEEAGHNTPVLWRRGDIPGDAVGVMYGDGGTVRDASLTPGSLYKLRLIAQFAEDDRVSNPRVALWSSSERHVDFWVAPKPAPVPVQGTMMVSNCCPGPPAVWFLTGDNTTVIPGPAGIRPEGDLSPDGQWVVYQDFSSARACRPDGSDDHLIIEMPGSVCGLRWSPDGRRIAFNSPTEDDPTPPGCAGAGEVHTVNADGTGLTRLSHHVGPDSVQGWSPDGTRLLWMEWEVGDWQVRGMVGRVDGSSVQQITGPGMPVSTGELQWAPDGSRIGVNWLSWVGGELTGALGTIGPDGTGYQPLLSWTVPPAATNDWWFGPARMRWSPDGSQLAFTAALQTLPEGEGAHPDGELYLLNADGSGLVRLTYDYIKNYVSSWRGPNTTPGANASTTICDTTITFAEVTDPGLTTATVTETPIDPVDPEPTNFQFIDEYYSISTTASTIGSITIQIHYEDAEVPDGNEDALKLLHWESGHWVDITTGIDKDNNVITGQCTALSSFVIGSGPKLEGLLPPVNNDGSSIFKLNSTVPVKFKLTAADGSLLTTADARLAVAPVSDQIVGRYEEAASTNAPDAGNAFHYDPEEQQYVFNLGTKGRAPGTYSLKVSVNGVVMKEVLISLK